jgi:hypothetical protein
MKKAFFFWLLFLCGCAPQKIWFNPTRNFTQAQTDQHECQQSGEVSACMKARGYYLVDKKFADTYRRAE